MATPVYGEGGVSPEIARLRAQLAKDPGSKLFMPLAEEYLKAGMAEEAISALENGLNANPYYMSAKVLLGKAYLQNGDTGKAKEQFEAVVKAIPDNLVANRKLGEIYLGMGMMAEAVSSFQDNYAPEPQGRGGKGPAEGSVIAAGCQFRGTRGRGTNCRAG